MDPGARAVAKQAAKDLRKKMDGLLSRIDAQHKAEIEKFKKAVGEVPDFQGTLGKLGP